MCVLAAEHCSNLKNVLTFFFPYKPYAPLKVCLLMGNCSTSAPQISYSILSFLIGCAFLLLFYQVCAYVFFPNKPYAPLKVCLLMGNRSTSASQNLQFYKNFYKKVGCAFLLRSIALISSMCLCFFPTNHTLL